MKKRRVVITGIGPLCSLGSTGKEFWKNLVNGDCGYSDAKGLGGHVLLSRLNDFDHRAYLSPGVLRHFEEYGYGSLAGRSFAMGIACAREAVKDSQIEDIDLRHASVFMGSGAGDLGVLMKYPEGFRRGALLQNNFLPSLVAQDLGITGETQFVSGACATGISTLLQGYRAIASGESRFSLVGSVEAPIGHSRYFNMGEFASRKSVGMVPFSQERDGPVLGEGGAVLVLEDLESASSRGVEIYCEVLGVSCVTEYADSGNPIHITSRGYARVIDLAIRRSGVDFSSIGYVNAHGTATIMNDREESDAIFQTVGSKVPVSSFKGTTGHLQAGSGSLELAGCAMAHSKKHIPRSNLGSSSGVGDCAELDYVTCDRRLKERSHILKLAAGFNSVYGAAVLGPLF